MRCGRFSTLSHAPVLDVKSLVRFRLSIFLIPEFFLDRVRQNVPYEVISSKMFRGILSTYDFVIMIS